MASTLAISPSPTLSLRASAPSTPTPFRRRSHSPATTILPRYNVSFSNPSQSRRHLLSLSVLIVSILLTLFLVASYLTTPNNQSSAPAPHTSVSDAEFAQDEEEERIAASSATLSHVDYHRGPPSALALEVHTHLASRDTVCRVHGVCRTRHGTRLYVPPAILMGSPGKSAPIAACEMGDVQPLTRAVIRSWKRDGAVAGKGPQRGGIDPDEERIGFIGYDLIGVKSRAAHVAKRFFWDVLPAVAALDAVVRGEEQSGQLAAEGQLRVRGQQIPGYKSVFFDGRGQPVNSTAEGVAEAVDPARANHVVLLQSSSLLQKDHSTRQKDAWMEAFWKSIPPAGATPIAEDEIYGTERGAEGVECFKSVLLPGAAHSNYSLLLADRSATYYTHNGISRAPWVPQTSPCEAKVIIVKSAAPDSVADSPGIAQVDKLAETISKLGGKEGTLNLKVEVVSFQAHDFDDQVAAVQSASVIVAPHSDELANTFFLRPGSIVVEVTPFGFEADHYKQLVQAVGGHHKRVVADPDTSRFAACLEHLIGPRDGANWTYAGPFERNFKDAAQRWRTTRDSTVHLRLSEHLRLQERNRSSGAYQSAADIEICALSQMLAVEIDSVASMVAGESSRLCKQRR